MQQNLLFGPVAQMAERLTVNQDVTGSIPVGSARSSKHDGEFTEVGACTSLVFRAVYILRDGGAVSLPAS